MAANERVTENLVRDRLRDLGYFADASDTRVEEQRSQIAEIRRLLKGASKGGGSGTGSPEFIITSASVPDFVLVVECKGDVRKHESANLDKPVEFAVDGAVHYAKYLSASYHVITVAVSGQDTDELKISTYLWPRRAEGFRELTARSGAALDDLVSYPDYLDAAQFDPAVEAARVSDLMGFSKELHNFMRDYGKLTEAEKPLLVSGTLLALRNNAFAKSYGSYSPAELQRQWLRVVKDELEAAEIPQAKKINMTQPYSTIGVHPELGKPTLTHPRGVLYELIAMLAEHVLPLTRTYEGFDVVGQFYGEFLKYTGGDGKALGIVLTPRHVTELFAELANVNKNDIVLDTCAGTGGFLISAMNRMLSGATTEAERDQIRKKRLVGVEQQPGMYALAASNMILRGDGKANLYQGSCFDEGVSKAVKAHKANIGLINPPYNQKGAGLSELSFVQHMLDLLDQGGTGIAIVPMSCATAPSVEKATLLKSHTLEAVMSMPNELFSPVGVITCVMVFTAHKPHATSNKKTWFGYWRDDGFVKTKHMGRVDLHGRWSGIRDHWVESFRNREVLTGESVTHYVTSDDEWCAEAYMETDYSKLTQADFDTTVRNYAISQLLLALRNEPEALDED
ncbi:SAM-dependent DNA methyltransferase [Cryobacterium sp. Hh7]|uniref:HsdM family class I SAM-dependent methyltransferase n=1 Tax=Cryobacterium sp. Hh7 TaxID=1259159 RepID=UPI00106BCB85|nr:N-6 DNA methylase [Cryobacterium sp. Hh7]TFD50687.1 SAM-dependent DNA methyltransferase [Cryobacterium sp. Hh7]